MQSENRDKKNQFRNGTLGVCKTFTINLLIIFLLNFWCFSIMVFDSTQCWMDGRPDNGYFRIPHNFSDLLTPLRHLDLNLYCLLIISLKITILQQIEAIPSSVTRGIWILSHYSPALMIWRSGKGKEKKVSTLHAQVHYVALHNIFFCCRNKLIIIRL